MTENLILGIDPGLKNTGWGVNPEDEDQFRKYFISLQMKNNFLHQITDTGA